MFPYLQNKSAFESLLALNLQFPMTTFLLISLDKPLTPNSTVSWIISRIDNSEVTNILRQSILFPVKLVIMATSPKLSGSFLQYCTCQEKIYIYREKSGALTGKKQSAYITVWVKEWFPRRLGESWHFRKVFCLYANSTIHDENCEFIFHSKPLIVAGSMYIKTWFKIGFKFSVC